MSRTIADGNSKATGCLYCWLILAALLLAGCSGPSRQWGNALAPDLQHAALADFTRIAERDKRCPTTMIADAALTYTSPVASRSVSGFLQFSLPEDYKFVITNPLGQIFWAVAGDRRQYQIVDTTKRLYATGKLQTLVLNNELPLFLVQNSWGEWLMARNHFSSSRVIAVRSDNEHRGVWFTVEKSLVEGRYEHLLIDLGRQILLQRVLADRSGDTLATVSYNKIGKKIDKGQCVQPEHITITGLDYGSTIELRLSAIEFQPGKKSYHLPRPPRYRQSFSADEISIKER